VYSITLQTLKSLPSYTAF